MYQITINGTIGPEFSNLTAAQQHMEKLVKNALQKKYEILKASGGYVIKTPTGWVDYCIEGIQAHLSPNSKYK